jgi:predicted transposase/invertase (TIGR01784 family)
MPYLASWERNARKVGIKEGKEVGKREGVSEEKIRIAKELFKMGVDVDNIAAAKGLNRDRIEKLASTSH